MVNRTWNTPLNGVNIQTTPTNKATITNNTSVSDTNLFTPDICFVVRGTNVIYFCKIKTDIVLNTNVVTDAPIFFKLSDSTLGKFGNDWEYLHNLPDTTEL